jgi:hypothetical protein
MVDPRLRFDRHEALQDIHRTPERQRQPRRTMSLATMSVVTMPLVTMSIATMSVATMSVVPAPKAPKRASGQKRHEQYPRLAEGDSLRNMTYGYFG